MNHLLCSNMVFLKEMQSLRLDLMVHVVAILVKWQVPWGRNYFGWMSINGPIEEFTGLCWTLLAAGLSLPPDSQVQRQGRCGAAQ
jgi:hypothetical protein